MSRAMEKVIELAIATRIIDDALAEGWSVTVNDGEEDVVSATRSRDRACILDALCSTDEDRVYFHKDGEQEPFGWVWLVWGNGTDLLSDYTTNLSPDDGDTGVLKAALKLSDDLAEGRFSVVSHDDARELVEAVRQDVAEEWHRQNRSGVFAYEARGYRSGWGDKADMIFARIKTLLPIGQDRQG